MATRGTGAGMSTHSLMLLCALHSAALGVFHLCFWRLFDWKRALAKLDRPNRAIMQILNLRLAFVFFATDPAFRVLPAFPPLPAFADLAPVPGSFTCFFLAIT